MVTLFIILSSYYVLKTVREGLILAGGTSLPWVGEIKGDELKIGATGAMALLMLVIIPAYGRLASRVDRKRLLEVSYAAIVGSLAVFFALGGAGVAVGLWFFIWLGIVNMFVIAQFWSYANDLHTEDQGTRLFAIIAIGGTAGAIVGPLVVKALAPAIGVFGMMGVAAGMFVAALLLFQVVEAMSTRGGGGGGEPVGKGGGFQLVLSERYLLLIGVMLILANLVNTTGEFILSHAAREHAAGAPPEKRGEIISEFYADFFFWVNLVGFLIQSFLASRIIQHAGVRLALLVLPTIALAGYGLVGAIGTLMLLRVMKTAENATDYSLQNTVRQSLFLPTSREVKYKAKAALDTFFVRFGDTAAALVVLGGINLLGLGPTEFAFVNVGVAAVWIVVAVAIGVHYQRLSRKEVRG
jgi:AAA family ATP:ADP antiporter